MELNPAVFIDNEGKIQVIDSSSCSTISNNVVISESNMTDLFSDGGSLVEFVDRKLVEFDGAKSAEFGGVKSVDFDDGMMADIDGKTADIDGHKMADFGININNPLPSISLDENAEYSPYTEFIESDMYLNDIQYLFEQRQDNSCVNSSSSLCSSSCMNSNSNGTLLDNPHCSAESTCYHEIGLDYLPIQRRNLVAKTGGAFTMIIVGGTGTGKTTFINTLFGEPLLPNVWSCEAAPANPTKVLTVHRAELVEDGFSLRFTAIDTPGYGNLTNNSSCWMPAVKYIDEQFRLFLFQEEQPIRTKRRDTRVHCCLYFINPSGSTMSPIDVIAMQQLSHRVNLIPIIGKSDTFSKPDLVLFKEVVNETLKLNNIKVCDFLTDNQLNHKIEQQIPFAIIGSENKVMNQYGNMVRGRKYRWGIAEVENPDHCDFISLRDLLMGDHMLDFVISTDSHYENYRSFLLTARFDYMVKKKMNLDVEDPNFVHLAEKCAKNIANDEDSEKKLGASTSGPTKSIFTSEDMDIEKLKSQSLEALKLFSCVNLIQVEKKLREKDPVLLEKQAMLKGEFSKIVGLQETRFREWKKSLVDRQTELNEDIQMIHQHFTDLQFEIEQLEEVAV